MNASATKRVDDPWTKPDTGPWLSPPPTALSSTRSPISRSPPATGDGALWLRGRVEGRRLAGHRRRPRRGSDHPRRPRAARAGRAGAGGRIGGRGALPRRERDLFCVDPVDGTREFIARNGEFTVNIALVDHGRPVAGVVLAPATGTLWIGGPDGARRAVVPAGGGFRTRPSTARSASGPVPPRRWRSSAAPTATSASTPGSRPAA